MNGTTQLEIEPILESSRRFALIPMVDYAAVVLVACEAASFFVSQYRANSLATFSAVTLALVAYLLVRLLIRKAWHSTVIAVSLGLGGAWFSLSGIHQFLTGANRLEKSGFHDLLAFRSSLMHPLPGWIPGECFTAILLSLACASGGAAYLWLRGSGKRKIQAAITLLAALVIASTLFLSLSRAVYWSVVLFVFVTCGLMVAYGVVTIKAGSLLFGSSMLALAVTLACTSAIYPGIFRAYFGSHTSQLRSTQGRFEIWSRSLKLAREHPWFGVGSSNAPLFLLSTADQDDTTGFASRPFSLPIQILVEKGRLGLALYTTFLLLIGVEFHRSMRSSSEPEGRRVSTKTMRNRERLETQASAFKAMKCCFAAALIAVLFRELTYSSLFEHAMTLVLAFILAALAIQRESVTA